MPAMIFKYLLENALFLLITFSYFPPALKISHVRLAERVVKGIRRLPLKYLCYKPVLLLMYHVLVIQVAQKALVFIVSISLEGSTMGSMVLTLHVLVPHQGALTTQ